LLGRPHHCVSSARTYILVQHGRQRCVNVHFPPRPSSDHDLHAFLRPDGPTPSGNGPTLSLPSNALPPD
jgi:hypothetical protein